jgi:hypothetical protein
MVDDLEDDGRIVFEKEQVEEKPTLKKMIMMMILCFVRDVFGVVINIDCVRPLESLLHIEATAGTKVFRNPESHLSQLTINNSAVIKTYLIVRHVLSGQP